MHVNSTCNFLPSIYRRTIHNLLHQLMLDCAINWLQAMIHQVDWPVCSSIMDTLLLKQQFHYQANMGVGKACCYCDFATLCTSCKPIIKVLGGHDMSLWCLQRMPAFQLESKHAHACISPKGCLTHSTRLQRYVPSCNRGSGQVANQGKDKGVEGERGKGGGLGGKEEGGWRWARSFCCIIHLCFGHALAVICNGLTPLQPQAQQPEGKGRGKGNANQGSAGTSPQTNAFNKQHANCDYSQPIRPQHDGV